MYYLTLLSLIDGVKQQYNVADNIRPTLAPESGDDIGSIYPQLLSLTDLYAHVTKPPILEPLITVSRFNIISNIAVFYSLKFLNKAVYVSDDAVENDFLSNCDNNSDILLI